MKKTIAIILSIMLVLAITLQTAAVSSIAVKSIKLNNSKITLKVGQTSNLKVTFTPANTSQKTLTYVTSNKKVATVDSAGVITGVHEGYTLITVYTPNKKIFAKCNVTILQKKPITIKAAIAPFNIIGIQDDIIQNEIIKEKFNITINITASGDKWAEKFATMMASGDLGDLIVLSDSAPAIKAGLFLPLDELLDKYGADIKKNAAEAIDFSRDNRSDGSGKLYVIGNLIDKAPVASGNIEPSFQVMWELFKKVGGEIPNNLDGMLTVLKKMQDAYPVNEKGQKTYGISSWSDWDGGKIAAISEAVLRFYGTQTTGYNEFSYDGKVDTIFRPDSAYFKSAQWYFKANQMGLLDPDSMTQKFDTGLQKLKDGRVLSAFWSWMGDIYNAEPKVMSNPMLGLKPIYPKDVILLSNAPRYTGAYFIGIGSKTKYADRIMEFINYLYTPEGVSNIINGPQSKWWDIRSGKAQFTPAIMAEIKVGTHSTAPFNWSNILGLSPDAVDQRTGEPYNNQYWSQVLDARKNSLDKDWSTVMGSANAAEWAKKNLKVYNASPAINSMAKKPDDINAIDAQLVFLAQYSWKMIYAKDQAEFDKLKAECIAKAKAVGSDKYDEWVKKAYADAKQVISKYIK